MDELLTAVRNNNVEEVRSLLNRGVSPEHGDDEENPLTYAAENGNLEIVKLLVEHRGDTKHTIYGAAIGGHIEVVRYLLENGVRASEYDISIASKNGHTEIVKLLLDHGAEASAKALTAASRYGHVEIVRLILAESQSSALNPLNALKWARKNGHTKVVRLLLKHPRLKNSKYAKEIMKEDHDYIMGSAMAFRHSVPRLPPYVLGQILSENVSAYDLGNIAESITHILQPTMEVSDRDERVKRPRISLK